jgi:hypothetical protein
MRIYASDGKTPLLRSMLIDEESGKQLLSSAIGYEDFEDAVDLEAAAKYSDDERRIPFIMFSENPMRDGTVVGVAGYDLAPWGKNGMPFLDCHNQEKAQLGHMENVDKGATMKKNGARAVRADGVFSTDPVHIEAAVKYGLYRDGHQKSGSIGINILQWKFREFSKDPKQWDQEDNPELYFMPPIAIPKSRGMEFSACSVGRHMDALVTKAGLVVGASESQMEEALVEICRGVVGYNGGGRLRRDQAVALARATVRNPAEAAAEGATSGRPFEPPAPQAPAPPPAIDTAREPLSRVAEYRNLDANGLILMLRVVPDKVLSDLGITGGNTR